MKRRSVCISITLALLLLTHFVFPQNKPAAPQPQQLYVVTNVRVQSGMVDEWMNIMKKELLPIWQKAGTEIGVWKTATFGESNNDFMISRTIQDLGELDGQNLVLKELGQEGARALMARVNRVSTGMGTFMIVSRPELSIAPASLGGSQLVVLTTMNVAPGRAEEFEKGYKEVLLPILKKTNVKGVLTYKRVMGGDPNEYGSLSFFDSFADLGQFGPARAKAFAEAKPGPMTPGAVLHIEQHTVRLVPELSTQVSPIIGKWTTTAKYCMEYFADGKWSVAQNGKEKPFDFGTYTLDGKLLTFYTDKKAGNCAGKTGKYEVNVTTNGQINYKLISDECSDRSGDLTKGPYGRYVP
jgi:hypothetical protein